MDTGSVNGLLGSLLSDPGALSAMAALLSQKTGVVSSQDAPLPDPPPVAGSGTDAPAASDGTAGSGSGSGGGSGESGDIGAVLSSLLSDPSVRAAIPGILSALGGAGGGVRSSPFSSPNAAPPFPPPSPAKRPVRPTDRRSALLLALKPYLSPEKQELVDTLVRIMEIFSLIQ